MALNVAHFAENAVAACATVACTTVSQPRTVVREQASLLLIDHEPDALSGLADLLAAAGYRCVCSTDGQSAAECLRNLIPDLILSDINLAGYSGVTLCERLKQAAGMADVPVMFFSGTQVPDIIRRSHSAGGTYYLRKPCDPDVLLELIGKALEAPRLVHDTSDRN